MSDVEKIIDAIGGLRNAVLKGKFKDEQLKDICKRIEDLSKELLKKLQD